MTHPDTTPVADVDFKLLFESSPGLFLILSPELHIVAVSDAYTHATMTQRSQILGRYIFDVFPDNPDDPNADGTRNLRRSLERVLEQKMPDTMAVQKYDIRKPEAQGGGFEERYWHPMNMPVFGNDGRIKYILHCAQDVTHIIKLDQKREEAQEETSQIREYSQRVQLESYARVQASETTLKNLVHTVLDTIIDGVITINERGEIQSYNKACIKLFGYTLEEVRGKNVSMLMPAPYQAEHDDYLSNYQRTNQAKIIGIGREVSGRRKDGSVFPMELAVGQTNQGGDHAFVGIIRDISERREAEKAREQLRQSQKMEALGQLTGGIAHDFNNLLAVILGNLDFMLERAQGDDDLRSFITPSITAAEHGAELTRQLLAFGRKQALQPRVICINELLGVFTPFVRHTLGERISTIMCLEPDVWNIHVDPTQIQNALLNLAVNARDAMPGGGKLIFETKNVTFDESFENSTMEMPAGEYVMIAVSDTGAGMSRDVLEKAFEPFFTTKDVGKGTGLGLSMVYGFVKQSQGHVKLYSEPDHGTSVKIYLPRADSASEVEQKPELKHFYKSHTTKTILVVEDNKEVLRLTSAMVESLGYRAIRAESGDEALKILETNKDIDLLLSDVMLPGQINGPELAKRALKMNPEMRVLFNSGYAEHAIFQSGLLEAGVHLIGKPFRKEQLASRLVELLA